jgi:dTMP kinase
MRAALDAGKPVLLDRYVYSNSAYQCAKLKDITQRRNLRNWIFHTEYGDFGLPEPDLNLFLDVPIGFVEQSLSRERSGEDRNYLEGARDIHEASIAFQREVRSMYLAQTQLDRQFLRIDCANANGEMLPPGAIFAKVRGIIDPYLK